MSQINYTNKQTRNRYVSRADDQQQTTSTAKTFLGGLFNLAFLASCLLLAASVFLQWRDTKAVSSTGGNLVLQVTGWDTGLLGGQGLLIITAVAAIIFCLAVNRIKWIGVALAVPLLIMVGLTTKAVLEIYNNRTDLTGQHTALTLGFYVAMAGSDLLIFYLIFLISRLRKTSSSNLSY